MKKTLLALAITMAAITAQAQTSAQLGVDASAIYDTNTQTAGSRVTLDFPSVAQYGFTPTVTASYVDNWYARTGVGADYRFKIDSPVTVKASTAVVYQDSFGGNPSGGGLLLGMKAVYPVSKVFDLTSSVDFFVGQSKIGQYNGAVIGLGLKAKL